MKESIFDVSTETLNAATFWINYVTRRKCIPLTACLSQSLNNAIIACTCVLILINIILSHLVDVITSSYILMLLCKFSK